jgi:hypothetical protein
MKNVKEKILFIVFVAALVAVEFLTAWLLRSMPNTMMKLVLLSVPLLVCMLVGTILFMSFEGVKQNEN